MSAATLSHGSADTPARQNFWRRRVLQPIHRQLTQGVSPDKIAATLAVGTACSLFPFLGFTSLLNFAVGLALRMNQPILQMLNQLLGPVQLGLILIYVRVGEAIWGQSGDRFTVGEMIHVFREAALLDFVRRFGWAGIHALTAWVLTSPLIIGAIYFAVRPALRRAAALRQP